MMNSSNRAHLIKLIIGQTVKVQTPREQALWHRKFNFFVISVISGLGWFILPKVLEYIDPHSHSFILTTNFFSFFNVWKMGLDFMGMNSQATYLLVFTCMLNCTTIFYLFNVLLMLKYYAYMLLATCYKSQEEAVLRNILWML